MESYWITHEADRRDLDLLNEYASSRQSLSNEAWYRAETTLRRSWDRFSAFGTAGVLYRDAVIKPLHDRFNAGDRSFELLCQILSI